MQSDHRTPLHVPLGPPQPLPRLEHQVKPPGIYLLAEDGSRWRLMDCIMVGGKLRRATLESVRATCRLFMDRTGTMRQYGRKPREDWRILPSLLQRQLQEARVTQAQFADGETVPVY